MMEIGCKIIFSCTSSFLHILLSSPTFSLPLFLSFFPPLSPLLLVPQSDIMRFPTNCEGDRN